MLFRSVRFCLLSSQGRSGRTDCEDVLELGEGDSVLAVLRRRRLATEELGELGVKVDERLGDDLALGRVGEEKFRLREPEEDVSDCDAAPSVPISQQQVSDILTLPDEVKCVLHRLWG